MGFCTSPCGGDRLCDSDPVCNGDDRCVPKKMAESSQVMTYQSIGGHHTHFNIIAVSNEIIQAYGTTVQYNTR